MYFGFSDIWKEGIVDAPIDQIASDVIRLSNVVNDGFTFPCDANGMRDAAIAPSSIERMYFISRARGSSTSCPGGQPSRFFRAQYPPVYLPELAFEEVVGSLPTTDVAVSALEVDPDDPMHVYIAYSGYEEGFKVFHSFDAGEPGTWLNMDPGPVHELPNLPVNDIALHGGTDGGIYVAMDVGIYYWSGSTDGWEPYFTDLPNVQVTDLDINHCAGKIRAATAGRAVWESDLAERTSLEKIVSGTLTWDRHMNLTQDIRVSTGAQFTITGTVNFAPETKLIIEPGAKVIVDGGILHNSCGLYWEGVEVLGNSALSQTPSTNQGFLILKNNAVVENASVGVKLFGTDANGDPIPGTTGGIVQTSSGASFKDCGRDVWFKPYQNLFAGVEGPNRSKFHETTFSSGDDGTGKAHTTRMVELDGVAGITFHDCDLFCTAMVPDTEPWHRPTGIWSTDSRFLVDACDFSLLNAGVRAKDLTGTRPCYIRNNTFDRVARGVGLINVYNAEITGNFFKIHSLAGSWSLDGGLTVFYPCGVYLSGCAGYEVEENDFAGSAPEGNVGMVIAGSTQLPDQFYRNHFRKLYVGSLLQGNNRTSDGLGGVQFLCNLYGNDDGTDGCIYNAAVTKDNAAIAPFVGTTSAPAGNRFYPECPGGLELDIYHDNESPNGVTYSHHSDLFAEPQCSTPPPHVVLDPTFQLFILGDGPTSSCPKDPSIVPSTISLKAAFHGAAGEHAALKAVYDGEVNGGNGEYLLGLIEDPAYSGAAVRNALLAASPKLDDKVLLAALYRDPAMDDAHRAQVLLANSPLTPDVLIGMEKSEMSSYYQDLVRAGQEGEPNWRVLVEGDLAALRAAAELARHDYLRRVLADTLGQPLDSLDLLLNDEDLAGRPAERLGLLLARHEWAAAADFLDAAVENGLSSKQAIVYQKVLEVLEDPASAVVRIQEAEGELRDIGADENADCQALARNLLEHYLGEVFSEPMYLPKEEKRGGVLAATNGAGSKWTIRAQPNPANDRLLVITHAPMHDVVYYVSLYDAYGHELDRQRLMPGPAIAEFDVRHYAPGLYRVALWGHHQGLVDGLSITIVH